MIFEYDVLEKIEIERIEKTLSEEELGKLGKLYCTDLKCKEVSEGYKVPSVEEKMSGIYRI